MKRKEANPSIIFERQLLLRRELQKQTRQNKPISILGVVQSISLQPGKEMVGVEKRRDSEIQMDCFNQQADLETIINKK